MSETTEINAIITSTYHDGLTLGPFDSEQEARLAVDAWEREHPVPSSEDVLSFHLEPVEEQS